MARRTAGNDVPIAGTFLRRNTPSRTRLPRSVWIVLMLLLAVLVGGPLLGNRGLPTLWHLERERRNLEDEVLALRQREQMLAGDLKALANDREVLERVARDNYGMIYHGETVVRVINAPQAPDDTSAHD